MGNAIHPEKLLETSTKWTLVDVRKPVALAASGEIVEGAVWRHPFDALHWHEKLPPGKVVVYCVHGHEVSQAVSDYLRDMGIDARFVSGGFESMKAAGFAVIKRGPDGDESNE